MRMGSVWLPIMVWVLMMAVCCAGPMLLGRWRRVRGRLPQAPATMDAPRAAAAEDGHKERIDG